MRVRVATEEYKRKLTNEFRLVEEQDGEVQALLARLLCIRIGGYMEVYLKERIQRFVDNRHSHKIISKYVENSVRDITNLNNKKIQAVLSSFSNEWAEHFKENVTEEMKMSLGSIYDVRNNIAHGGNDSLSLKDIKKHFANIESALTIIDQAITKKT